MARAIQRQTRTPADELRDLLDASYKTAVHSRSASTKELRQLLLNLDRIDVLLPELEAQGVDLRPERTRWQEVQGAVKRHARNVLAGLRPVGGLKACRQSLPDTPDRDRRWWWWLDESLAARRRKRVRATLATIAGIVLLLVGGFYAFNQLFPVDENISAAYDHKINAEEFVAAGDLQSAVRELEAAYTYTPDDPDILTFLAALYDLTGQPQKAEPLLDQLYKEQPPGDVLSSLAQSYAMAGHLNKALELAKQAIAEAPEKPQGYLVAAMAYEAQGKNQQAIAYYQEAAEKANASGEYQVEAFAKVRLATLLQLPPR